MKGIGGITKTIGISTIRTTATGTDQRSAAAAAGPKNAQRPFATSRSHPAEAQQ
jgi:hypothetical protein